eukprot:gene31223-38581_t
MFKDQVGTSSSSSHASTTSRRKPPLSSHTKRDKHHHLKEEENNDTDDALPVMIPVDCASPPETYRSNGSTPSVFDSTQFREEYRSNLFTGGSVSSARTRRAHSSASTEGPFSAPRPHGSTHFARSSRDSSHSTEGKSPSTSTGWSKVSRSGEEEDEEESDDLDLNGNDDEDEDGNGGRLSALRIKRLSYGSQKSRKSVGSVVSSPLPPESEEQGGERSHSTGHSSTLLHIDINESILPVKRRGERKTKVATAAGTASTDGTVIAPVTFPTRQTRSRTTRSTFASGDTLSTGKEDHVTTSGTRTRAKSGVTKPYPK